MTLSQTGQTRRNAKTISKTYIIWPDLINFVHTMFLVFRFREENYLNYNFIDAQYQLDCIVTSV